jgi:hypothetical protein
MSAGKEELLMSLSNNGLNVSFYAVYAIGIRGGFVANRAL